MLEFDLFTTRVYLMQKSKLILSFKGITKYNQKCAMRYGA